MRSSGGILRGYLRVDEPRKNQRRGIRFAADYTLDNWLQSLGSGVANAQP
jgi:hypothetical protein